MNSLTRQYLFGAVFIGVGIYQAVQVQYLEMALYCVAGLAFIVNALVGHPRLQSYKKPLVLTTWALILVAAVLFFYVAKTWL